MVTAGGEVVRASEDENADLFWGLRGGGGNFGVVTQFEFNLNPLGPVVMAGPVFWRMEDSPQVLRFYRDWIAEAPDDLMTIVIHRKAPPLDFIPQELHGKRVVAVVACYAGPVEEGERVLKPLKSFGSPVLDLCQPKPYLEHQAMFDPSFPHGRWYYMRACDVAELSDEVIDITFEHAMQIQSPAHRVPDLADGRRGQPRGRRRHRVHEPRRGAHVQPDEHDRRPRGVRRGTAVDARLLVGARAPPMGVYVNFLMEEGEERVREAYGADKYDRLKALKQKYDPENLFRLNQNIRPGLSRIHLTWAGRSGSRESAASPARCCSESAARSGGSTCRRTGRQSPKSSSGTRTPPTGS